MELWQELFYNILKNEAMEIHFPQIRDISELVQTKCYQALWEIKQILNDDTLTDKECFMKIEEIICVFEKLDCQLGNRHDF
jgi:hypothetical protein